MVRVCHVAKQKCLVNHLGEFLNLSASLNLIIHFHMTKNQTSCKLLFAGVSLIKPLKCSRLVHFVSVTCVMSDVTL